jgi:AAA15 family ATPase/GTPase
MVCGKGAERSETHSFDPETKGAVPLLRSAAIYGPNASGKSNLLQALRSMRQIVKGSSVSSQRGEKIAVDPFLFDPATKNEPTEFEVVFIVEGIRYQYGFSATRERVWEEWLMAFPKGRVQHWFSRAYNSEVDDYQWDMGEKLTGQKQLWQESTRPNALFLSTAVQLNSAQLQPVFDWFGTVLRVVGLGGWSPFFTAKRCEDKDTKKQILEFLKSADTGLSDIKVNKDVFDPASLPSDMPTPLRQVIADEMKDEEIFDIKSIHQTALAGAVELAFDEESDGTRKIFSLAGPWLDTLNNGYVLIVDELHDNLHPHMVRFLVDLFHGPANKKNAQLIFSTHETSILSQDVFRRDQIWFCEKDNNQSTQLFPLTDFSPRKGLENLERSYLSGRYGALPYFQQIDLAMGGNRGRNKHDS